MEIVQDEIMYHISRNNSKFFEVGDEFEVGKTATPKYLQYKRYKKKLFKTQREKELVFNEKNLEKLRKQIDENLPSRFYSLFVSKNLDDSKALLEKWKTHNSYPSQILKLSLTGKLHRCVCTKDENKGLGMPKHIQLENMRNYWLGEKETSEEEYLFIGKVKIAEIIYDSRFDKPEKLEDIK